MPNHLINETSPYLLQHAHNPVEWYPWNHEALEKARRENKPIFVSIGYAACHWCHVMERESFEDSRIADLLNHHFVSIKVDREERPDLDMIYMQAVIAMTGQGGWPLNVFLTPEGRPFYGGTYFPPDSRYGMPAFQTVLEALANLWNEDPQKIEDTSTQLFQHVAEEVSWKGQNNQTILKSQNLDVAVQKLIDDYDWHYGGWGNAPKFPAPMTIDFLLTQASRGSKPSEAVAVHALQAMQRGGMYDVVGGGFHRYSTDNDWLVPHFEKMLYDNALLSLAYLHAYQMTGEISFRKTVEGTLDFVLRELTDADGRFFSSLDADSEGEEGLFYTWTLDELESILLDEADFKIFSQAFNLSPDGNADGKIILQYAADINEIANRTGLTIEEATYKIDDCLRKLLEYRSNHRVRPATDDKTLAAWNAFTLQAFAEAGRVLDRRDYTSAAKRNADFLLSHLYEDGRLVRSWRAGKGNQNGTLEDYAALSISLLALYQTDFNLRWYHTALELAKAIFEKFLDQDGGFYLTQLDLEDLPLRPKDLQDNATPSGNALAAYALLQLSAYNGNEDWLSKAQNTLVQLQDITVRYPTAFSYWLKAIDFAIGPMHQVALVWPDGKDVSKIFADFNQKFRPRMIVAASPEALLNGTPELLADRPPRDDNVTAYICHGFVCDLPVAGQEQILASLSGLD